jgi:hypothetical protein
VIKNIRDKNEGKAKFWSPKKLGTEMDEIQAQETSKQQAAIEREEKKRLKAE